MTAAVHYARNSVARPGGILTMLDDALLYSEEALGWLNTAIVPGWVAMLPKAWNALATLAWMAGIAYASGKATWQVCKLARLDRPMQAAGRGVKAWWRRQSPAELRVAQVEDRLDRLLARLGEKESRPAVGA